MNSKLLLGCFGFCSVMSFFVACGSGSIDPYSVDDQVASISVTLDKDKSISACLADPVCKADYEAAENPPSSAQTPSSSSSIPVVPGLSSGGLVQISSGGSVPPIQISSSSGPVVVVQTSGDVTGSCAPTPAVAELGQQVTWTFTKGPSESVANVTNASYDWVFQGGSEPVFNGQGAFGVTKTISYGTSGSHTTTLAINGGTPMTCAPVQINGAPITGCECAVDNASPDVAKGGVANWTVGGCVTSANITGYSWNGLPAVPTPTFSHTFLAKDETMAPTLSVYNDDNTVQPVTCPAATAIDANIPDYKLEDQNTAIILPAGVSTVVMNLPQDWHNTTIGTCSFSCSCATGSCTATVDGVPLTGAYHMTGSIPITSTINGYGLPVELGQEMSCQVGW